MPATAWFYRLFGLLVLGASGMADARGWLATRPTTVQNVPRSIRDNPGAYRSLYQGSPRYFGGK
jgi:hypothetical protein